MKQTIRREECGEEVAPRRHLAADVLIGGHATIDRDALVSFDRTFSATYFPALTVYPQ